MTSTLIGPEEAVQTVILDRISWDTYQRLMSERGENRQPRYSYDRGRLEIIVTSYEHENLTHNIATLIEIVAEALDIDLVAAGATTFDREDLSQGFEPDASFYITQSAIIKGKTKIDLAIDPPPELVVEVDISSPSLNKLPIFAGLGIPEVWRYHKHALTILTLAGADYQETLESHCFPGATSETLTQLIADARDMRRSAWLQKAREWAQELASHH